MIWHRWKQMLLPWMGVRDARLRLAEVRADNARLARHLSEVEREVALNDWTATAKRIFSGRG